MKSISKKLCEKLLEFPIYGENDVDFAILEEATDIFAVVRKNVEGNVEGMLNLLCE